MQAPPTIDTPIDSVMVSDTVMTILDTPGVSGVAAGKCPGTDSSGIANTVDCIVIYLSDQTVRPGLPATIAGYPVVIRDGGPAETNLR